MSAHAARTITQDKFSGPLITGALRRKCDCGTHTVGGGRCSSCAKKQAPLQRRAAGRDSASGALPVVRDVLRTAGSPLDAATRAFMEPRFRHDFSRVRVHTDSAAADSARAVNALAYTVGDHVVFGAGRYAPGTREGAHLLAHELAHVTQQSAQLSRAVSPPDVAELAPAQDERAEALADRAAAEVLSGRVAGPRPAAGGVPYLQKARLGTAFAHPAGSTSPYTRITATFDGREFVVHGDGTEIMRVSAQSGRPVTVRPPDARACGGSPDDSYMNNPRYVGITDFGAIPEGEYSFVATSMATFSTAERYQMLLGGQHTDPFGASLHGGDWGAGRVALNPIRVLPSRFRCGNTGARSGFYLHGGVMPGSSGCIDVGNSGVDTLVNLLAGYRRRVVVTVRYTHPAPSVGAFTRALGRFTYPTQENPSLVDRLGAALGF